jgi:hypothetical protein
MRLYGDEFVQLRHCVWDAIGFIIEQLQEALSHPTDQFAAVDAARGAIRQLQSRLARDGRLHAHTAWCISFNPYVFEPDWQDRWMELANKPTSAFATEARQLIEDLEQLRESIRRLPKSN